ncbi:MAG: MMPL family transporter [Candidatus Omnitrophica bacterium]|nr:MMPL family transporter [Candidatus Omnitrophota bacterium]
MPAKNFSKDPSPGPALKARLLQSVMLLVSGMLVFTVIRFFSLVPEVGGNFFFSSENPRFRDNSFLMKMFPGQASLIVVSVEGEINSGKYLEDIEGMSSDLLALKQVSDVKSLSRGPGSVEEARESPLWSRILIAEDSKASNIVMLIKRAEGGQVIREIESIIRAYEKAGYTVRIAGVPYIVEMIRRNLFYDLKVFSAIACVLFGITILFMFRSLHILAGTFIAASAAASATIIAGSLAGANIGILTANIITIIFVLTLSHIVYITHNWMDARNSSPPEKAPLEGVKVTFAASAWCMVTTFLGFGSLLFVQAKPIRELGIYGLFGTTMAITAAYLIYPVFLLTARPSGTPGEGRGFMRGFRQKLIKRTAPVAAAIGLLTILTLPGLRMLNTDPSLFAFFREGSSLREGLEFIDSNGGSTPLSIVVRDADGGPLTDADNYERLWELQYDLEEKQTVGSILSLPLILAEAKTYTLAALLTYEGLADILELPRFGSVADRFITEDRISTHFLLRMREEGRTRKRKAIAGELAEVVADHGFIPEIVSGLYLLQGELSALVADSVVTGITRILFFFFLIALVMSRSFRTAITMIISISVIPVVIFGAVGLLRVPVDLISAPAANIAIAMGIDSMIHFVMRSRRRRKESPGKPRMAWSDTQSDMWSPVMKETFIICLGFMIFTFSSFPPTNRFGMEIVFGTVISAVATLFILPYLAKVFSRIGKEAQGAERGTVSS